MAAHSCAQEMALKSDGWDLLRGQIRINLKTYQLLQHAFPTLAVQADVFW